MFCPAFPKGGKEAVCEVGNKLFDCGWLKLCESPFDFCPNRNPLCDSCAPLGALESVAAKFGETELCGDSEGTFIDAEGCGCAATRRAPRGRASLAIVLLKSENLANR